MARLFLAVWPGGAVRSTLGRLRDAWSWPDGARRVPDERLHLTLHFIGSFPREGIDAFADRLSAVPPRRMKLRPEGPEMWHGGLAVLRIAPEPGLMALHDDLGALLSAMALPVDSRPFKPHVTLARKAAGARWPGIVADLAWDADGFALVESVTGSNSAYRVLRSYPPLE